MYFANLSRYFGLIAFQWSMCNFCKFSPVNVATSRFLQSLFSATTPAMTTHFLTSPPLMPLFLPAMVRPAESSNLATATSVLHSLALCSL